MTAVDNPASGTTDAVDLFVSPLGRVEGDLDVRVTIEDGVVTSAWTEAAMFRGFEIILKGRDPGRPGRDRGSAGSAAAATSTRPATPSTPPGARTSRRTPR
ncbi:MAG: hypothetical protein R2734_20855 [Nocardioides sp.]